MSTADHLLEAFSNTNRSAEASNTLGLAKQLSPMYDVVNLRCCVVGKHREQGHVRERGGCGDLDHSDGDGVLHMFN